MAKPAATEKKQSWFGRHKVLTVILGIVVLFVIIGATNSNDPQNSTANTTSTSSSSNAAKKTRAPLATIGQAADDGKFAFTVNSLKCGETQVGDQYSGETAQGQYCRLNVSVKNIGNESQTLDTDSQYLYSAGGQKYSSDDSATIAASTNYVDPWDTDVNPGNTLTGDILFDVPKNVTPVTAELHDSAFSGGVKVNLQ